MPTTGTFQVASVFPTGTSVGAYKLSNWPSHSFDATGAPVGSADASATVATAGTIALTGLTANTTYRLAGQVSGVWQYMKVQTYDARNGSAVTSQAASAKPGLRIAGAGAVPIVGRTWHPNSGAQGAVNDKYNSCIAHVARFSTMNVRLVFTNYQALGGDQLTAQPLTVRAALEASPVAGTRVLVYFGGKRDVVIEPGGVVVSDMLAPSLLAGQAFRVWTYVTPAAGGQVPLSTVQPTLGTVQNNDGHERSATAVDKTNAVLHSFTATGTNGSPNLTAVTGLTSNIDLNGNLINVLGVAGVPTNATITAIGAGTATLSAPLTAPITGATLFVQPIAGPTEAQPTYQPAAILGYPAAATPIIAGVGDSVTVGTGDDFTDIDGTHWGYFERTFSGTGWARVNVSKGAEFVTSAIGIGARMRRALIEGATHIFENYGSNDVALRGNNGNTDASTIKANKITLWNELAYTGAKVWSMTICPRTNVGSFSTQTRLVRADLNSWLRDGAPISAGAAVAVGTVGAARCDVYNTAGTRIVSGSGAHPLTAIFDPQTTIETAVDSNVWIGGMDNGDATHPSPAGHAALAASLSLNLGLFTV